jgi:hypothetical protein
MKPDFTTEVPIRQSRYDNLDGILAASREMAAKGAKKVSYTDFPADGICVVQGWRERIVRLDKTRSYERVKERVRR